MADDRSATLRLFLALDIPPSLSELGVALQDSLNAELGSALFRPISADNLHVTLHFLGDCDAERQEAARNALTSVPAGTRSPVVTVEGATVFPPRGRPRTIVLALNDRTAALEQLHREVGYHLEAAGFSLDQRPFRPHLTLGYARKGISYHEGRLVRRTVEQMAIPANGAGQAQSGSTQGSDTERHRYRLGSLTLFKSELQRGGAIHTPLRSRELARSEEESPNGRAPR